MNNLLRTLTESRSKAHLQGLDLKLLLTNVKESRGSDHKLLDAFYDALEDLLQDLRTVTVDNHDPEPFLKPVAKSEYPDYYEVITSPMDLQTMLKKVRQKSYKSKKDFHDDLELIWSNCAQYNAPGHPIQNCAKRLKDKAEKLLKNITDRRDRTDPRIPLELGGSNTPRIDPAIVKTNGFVNGRVSRTKSSTPALNFMSGTSTPIPGKKNVPSEAEFALMPALVRTQEGMTEFLKLDKHLDTEGTEEAILARLRGLADEVSGTDTKSADGSEDAMEVDYDGSHKRKRSDSLEGRARKRTRVAVPLPDIDDLTQTWWAAAQSDSLIANGLPRISHASSRKMKRKQRPASAPEAETNPKSLLVLMNNNIRTMKRVRHTHAKFAALEEDAGPGGDGTGGGPPSHDHRVGLHAMEEDHVGVDDGSVDERPFLSRIQSPHNNSRHITGFDIGQKNATDCLNWMGSKVLEHSGFQGSSKGALDVLAGVTSEYLMNVGRTMKYMGDKHGKTMTPEEIILHTLFESGAAEFQDLERYIFDDIVRHGNRFSDLEKKLEAAYRETVNKTGLDDEDEEFNDLFEDEEEEDTGLAMGDFADMTGEDFFGFKELGIAAELGMSNMSVPKSLLRGKRRRNRNADAAAKPTEPPPPYPPPPPFVPLSAASALNQIGLLNNYYLNRFAALIPPPPPPPAAPPPLTLPGPDIQMQGVSQTTQEDTQSTVLPGPTTQALDGTTTAPATVPTSQQAGVSSQPSQPSLSPLSHPQPQPPSLPTLLPSTTSTPVAEPSLPAMPSSSADIPQLPPPPSQSPALPLPPPQQAQAPPEPTNTPAPTPTAPPLTVTTIPPRPPQPDWSMIKRETILPDDGAPSVAQTKMGPLGQIAVSSSHSSHHHGSGAGGGAAGGGGSGGSKAGAGAGAGSGGGGGSSKKKKDKSGAKDAAASTSASGNGPGPGTGLANASGEDVSKTSTMGAKKPSTTGSKATKKLGGGSNASSPQKTTTTPVVMPPVIAAG